MKKRALLVDDSRDNILLLSRILDHFGYSCKTAGSGQEAMDVVSQSDEAFDFILMDVCMPVMDGLTATRMIRSWEKDTGRRRSTIIGLTGMAVMGEDEHFRDSGMDDYLIKPFRMDDLEKKVFLAG